MIPLTLVALGIIMHLYSLYLSSSLMNKEEMRKPVKILFSLILFFFFGYIYYLFLLLSDITAHNAGTNIISSIFFFGAIFVVIVLKANIICLQKLEQNTIELANSKDELEKKIAELNLSKDELEKTKAEIFEKNKALEATMDEFYKMRFCLEKRTELGKFKNENMEIKEKITKLRGKRR